MAAAVNAISGINGISRALLQEGLSSLKNCVPPADYPEAIVACDSVALGSAIRIPGINVIGIAAESDVDTPELVIDVPCVIGVDDLLSSISERDIVIIDGYKGLVHIDPDPATLIHYQQAEEHHNLREKVFIASEHIPARTATGEVIYVYALPAAETELDAALDSGADGIVFDLRGRHDDAGAVAGNILREAAGKPVVLAVDMGWEDVLRAAMVYCTPNQLTLVSENAELLALQVERALDHVVLEALQLDIDPPQVTLGLFAHAPCCSHGCSPLVVDARNQEDGTVLPTLDSTSIFILDGPEQIRTAVESSSVKRVAVAPEKVAEAKTVVKSIGLEDEF